MDMGKDNQDTRMAHTPAEPASQAGLVGLVARRHILDKKELEDSSVQVDIPDSAQHSTVLVDSLSQTAGSPEPVDNQALAGEERAQCRGAIHCAHLLSEELTDLTHAHDRETADQRPYIPHPQVHLALQAS